MARENEVNKFDYNKDFAEQLSSSLWATRDIMDRRDGDGNQRYWTVEEIQVELRKMHFKIDEPSIQAHVRTLRKEAPTGGQYPCSPRWRKKQNPDDPRRYEYLLGEEGTGILNNEKHCEKCDHYLGIIRRYQALVQKYQEQLGA